MTEKQPNLGHPGPRVGLMVTCLVDLYRPNVGFAAIKLLEAAGCEVVVPPSQTCCGQPAYNSGDQKTSQAMAKNVITAFEQVDYVVVPSGSCAGMLKAHYPEILSDGDTDVVGGADAWSARAAKLVDRTYELTSFLVDVLGVDQVNAQFSENVTYHDSCSGLRELGIKKQPRMLLQSVAGLTLSEMDDTDVCCGFGGTFCVKYPEISSRMVTDKAALAQQTQANVLLSGDLGCLLNICGRLSRLGSSIAGYHVAEVLANMTNTPPIGKVVDNSRPPLSTNAKSEG